MWTAENAVWNSKAVYMWLNMTQHKRWSNEDQTGGRILQRCLLRGLKRRLRGLKAVFSLFSKLQLIYINNGRRVKLRPPRNNLNTFASQWNRSCSTYDATFASQWNQSCSTYDSTFLHLFVVLLSTKKKNLDRLVSIDYTWTVNL